MPVSWPNPKSRNGETSFTSLVVRAPKSHGKEYGCREGWKIRANSTIFHRPYHSRIHFLLLLSYLPASSPVALLFVFYAQAFLNYLHVPECVLLFLLSLPLHMLLFCLQESNAHLFFMAQLRCTWPIPLQVDLFSAPTLIPAELTTLPPSSLYLDIIWKPTTTLSRL